MIKTVQQYPVMASICSDHAPTSS